MCGFFFVASSGLRVRGIITGAVGIVLRPMLLEEAAITRLTASQDVDSLAISFLFPV
jgi:hypothetical protein